MMESTQTLNFCKNGIIPPDFKQQEELGKIIVNCFKFCPAERPALSDFKNTLLAENKSLCKQIQRKSLNNSSQNNNVNNSTNNNSISSGGNFS